VKLKRLYSICPQCGRRFAFEFTNCSTCRIINRNGTRGGEIALFHLTESEHGITWHPPEWFGRAAKLA